MYIIYSKFVEYKEYPNPFATVSEIKIYGVEITYHFKSSSP